MKIRPVGAELFHAGGRKDVQADMAKLLVAFRSFANSLKKSVGIWQKILLDIIHDCSSSPPPLPQNLPKLEVDH